MTGRVDNAAYAKQGIDALKEFGIHYSKISEGVTALTVNLLNDIKQQRLQLNDNASAKEVDDAVKAIKDSNQ